MYSTSGLFRIAINAHLGVCPGIDRETSYWTTNTCTSDISKQIKRPQSPSDKFITTKSCNHWQNRSLGHKHLMVAGWRRLCLWQQICNTSRSWASNRWRHSPGRTIKPLGHCFAFNHHTRLWSSFFGAFCCVTGDKCLKWIILCTRTII